LQRQLDVLTGNREALLAGTLEQLLSTHNSLKDLNQSVEKSKSPVKKCG